MTVRVLQGNCLDVLTTLPSDSVQCCVTSPPYFGLRSYLPDGHPDKHLEIGLEDSPEAYVARLVEVFREVRRVLRPDGTCWLNLGDSYAGSWGAQGHSGEMADRSVISARQIASHPRKASRTGVVRTEGVKQKDLYGIPWMVAFALRSDGWWLRSNVIWEKPAPMPESCTDRPTSSHEHVFLLAKSGEKTFWTNRDGGGARSAPEPDYRWIDLDADELREVSEPPPDWADERSVRDARQKRWKRINLWIGSDYFYDHEAIKERSVSDHPSGNGFKRPANLSKQNADGSPRGSDQQWNEVGGTRNARSVWRIGSSPFSEPHHAVMPAALAERCIKAGTSDAGCCPDCGAPWERIVQKGEPDLAHQRASGGDLAGAYSGLSTKGHDAAGVQNASDVKRRILAGMVQRRTIGWRPTCACPEHQPVPCTVLDPFGGAGTTGLAADRLGRDAVLIDLNAKYVTMARKRITSDAPLFSPVAAA